MGYLTVGELVQKTGIPETTVRRYLGIYNSFINSKKFGNTTKYNENCVKVIKNIYKKYQNGMKTEEIRDFLAESEPQYLEIRQNQLETLPADEVLDVLHKMQQKIDSLEHEIKGLKLLSDDRDIKLVAEMRKLFEEKQKKPFWQRFFS